MNKPSSPKCACLKTEQLSHRLRFGRPKLWIFSATLLFGSAMAFWSVAQSGRENAAHAKLPEEIFGKEPPMAVERQKALEAFHNPEAAAEEAAKNMTQEQWIAEQASILAITKPAAFTAEMEKFKTEEEKVKRQKAREAIVDPMKHSGPVKKGEKLPERVYNMEDFEKEKKQKAENQ